MYELMLALHSLMRWVVLLLGVLAVVRALGGWVGSKPWSDADERGGRLFVMSLDIQLVIGLMLYLFLSPVTRMAFQDFGLAMRTGSLRFWAVEHLTMMVIAVALVHIGRVRARRQTAGPARHRQTALFFGLAVIAMLVLTPWPGLSNGRPLFRLP